MPAINSTAASDDSGSDSGIRERRRAKQPAPQIKYRHATDADIIAFYGRPLRGTLKAYAILLDDVPQGFIGIVRENGVGKFFTEYRDELQPYLKSITIMRALKKSLDWCREYRGPVVAIAETAQGCATMNRLGFEHLDGAYYGWFDKWHR
jgi:hypothetical protein